MVAYSAFYHPELDLLDKIIKNTRSLTRIYLHASPVINDKTLEELIHREDGAFFKTRITHCQDQNITLSINLSHCTITETGAEKLIRFLQPFLESCKIELNLQDNNIQETPSLVKLLEQINSSNLELNIHGNPMTNPRLKQLI